MTDTQRAKVYDTWLKCTRLSNDSRTPTHEREAARVKSIELRAKLDAMDGEAAPATSLAAYRALVKQGKALLDEQENINWKLGELASQVDKQYGKAKLKEFADELEVSHSMLKDCRTTYLAWPQKAGRPAFWVARTLNAHPRHVELFEKNPDMTVQEARAKVQEYRERQAAKAEQELPPEPDSAVEVGKLLSNRSGPEIEKICTGLIKSRKLFEGACELPWASYFEYREAHPDECSSLTPDDLAYVQQWTSVPPDEDQLQEMGWSYLSWLDTVLHNPKTPWAKVIEVVGVEKVRAIVDELNSRLEQYSPKP